MSEYKTILVTGCPRSGTTPVGSNLALAPGARYLYEPFNPSYGLRTISRFYEVPGANGFSMERLDGCIAAIRQLRLDLKRFNWPRETPARRLLKRVVGGRAQLSYLLCRLDWTLDTVIWKDPIACFATAAVVDRHRIPVVVTVRPPAAVAASYKRLQWEPGVFAVVRSLSQVGIEYPDLLHHYGRHAENPVIGAALLWWVVYATLLRWAESRPLIRFLSLQESIDRPIDVYRDFYRFLGLRWTPRVERKLTKQSLSQTGREPIPDRPLPKRAHIARRRLDEINTYGSKLLTSVEAAIIEEMTSDLWSQVSAACLAWEDRERIGA